MNVFRTGLLLAAMTALFLVVGAMLGGEMGMVIAFVVAIGMNFFAYWNSDKMVLSMYGAKVVTRATAPDLWQMVADLAERAQLPMPAVYIMENDQPNAFATGRDPQHAAVAVTTGIMRVLSREELAGVIAHELAHIKNRDTLIMTVAATIAGAIGMLANFGFLFGHTREGERPNPIIGIMVMILAPLAATLVQMAISRTREFSADRLGAEICGDPAWLANALQRIEQFASGTYNAPAEENPATAHMFIINPLHGGGIAGLFRTHPPTEQRIAALMSLGRPGSGPVRRQQAPAGHARRPHGGPTRRAGSVPDAGGGRSSGGGRSPWQR